MFRVPLGKHSFAFDCSVRKKESFVCVMGRKYIWIYVSFFPRHICALTCVINGYKRRDVEMCTYTGATIKKRHFQPQLSFYQPMTNLHLRVGSGLHMHMWKLALIPQLLRYHPPPEALTE